ncbi:carbonic anhydrase [Dothidotthia symphoricarpi CBS 119687]|uniref:Carbonic anhydrase n=1 Tax=Dothidotthia symphoricarpi CBS 119687 TaxID=1392245 RepID=A0A6A6ALL2_9PLEO|nr:carbonic anhydrase [Dothidotthia symphoricarpi CBS 119687]KAF2132008.1 carbonic anhydrase [Dothidotthia symphoricarpi CBS 119687]
MLFKQLIFASMASASCMHGLEMFKRADVAQWGFGPLNGPFNWASLAPANAVCKSGKNQSPINIDSTIGAAPSRPVLDVRDGAVEFENLGTTIEVVVNGTTRYNNADYQLVQFHMHTPSEHHINSEYYPLEVHFVHQRVSDNTQLAVIAFMFELSTGKSDPVISGLSSTVPKIATPGSHETIAKGLDFSGIYSKLKTSQILTYRGSLTTPPCAEGVTFLIVKDALPISVPDFNAIKKVVKFNSRFLQNKLGEPNMLDIAARAGVAA